MAEFNDIDSPLQDEVTGGSTAPSALMITSVASIMALVPALIVAPSLSWKIFQRVKGVFPLLSTGLRKKGQSLSGKSLVKENVEVIHSVLMDDQNSQDDFSDSKDLSSVRESGHSFCAESVVVGAVASPINTRDIIKGLRTHQGDSNAVVWLKAQDFNSLSEQDQIDYSKFVSSFAKFSKTIAESKLDPASASLVLKAFIESESPFLKRIFTDYQTAINQQLYSKIELDAMNKVLSSPEVMDMFKRILQDKDNLNNTPSEEQPKLQSLASNPLPYETRSKRRGAPVQIWLQEPYASAYTEISAGNNIQVNVWPNLEKRLREFIFPTSLKGEKYESTLKAFGTAILWYSAQNIGLAQRGSYSASMSRTMQFLGPKSTTVKGYSSLLEHYEKANEIAFSDDEDRDTKFLYLVKTVEKIDNCKGFILKNNFKAIRNIISETESNLKKAFNM